MNEIQIESVAGLLVMGGVGKRPVIVELDLDVPSLAQLVPPVGQQVASRNRD